METGKAFTDSLSVGERMRALNPSKVDRLAESMAAIGLQQPISVWAPDSETAVLIAGHHRLAAARKLGWEQIDCIFVNLDDIDRQLWEIDENLMRAELTPAQEAEHLKRRKELFERKAAQVGSVSGGRGNKGFAAETAEKTGHSKTDINRAIARAEKVAVINDVVGTSLDKGVELDALAKLPEAEQRRLAERAKAGERVSARPTMGSAKSRDTKRLEDRTAKEDADDALADLLAEYIPGEHWDALKSNLYTAGYRGLAKAFTRLTGTSVFDNTRAGVA